MERTQSSKRTDPIDRALWSAQTATAADRVIARFLRGDVQGLTLADLIVLEHDVTACAVQP